VFAPTTASTIPETKLAYSDPSWANVNARVPSSRVLVPEVCEIPNDARCPRDAQYAMCSAQCSARRTPHCGDAIIRWMCAGAIPYRVVAAPTSSTATRVARVPTETWPYARRFIGDERRASAGALVSRALCVPGSSRSPSAEACPIFVTGWFTPLIARMQGSLARTAHSPM